MVGNHPPDFDLPGLIHGLGLDEQVVLTGWLDPVQFTQHMVLADIGIHLRYPHIGGTPFTPIRLMGLGIPTIVSDIGPLAELPEGACAKIPPDQFEEDALMAVLAHLADREPLRRRLGENGAGWIREHHDAARIAARYIAAIGEAATESPPAPTSDYEADHRLAYLVREMAALAARLGIREEDVGFLSPMAEAIASQAAAQRGLSRTVEHLPDCGDVT